MQVLIVDDDPEIREYFGWMLTEAGHAPAFAGSGEDALAMMRDCRPDVIVTDLLMPSGNGMQVVDAARTAGIPCIVVSGYGLQYQAVMPRGTLVIEKCGDDVLRLPAAVIEVSRRALAATSAC